MSIDDPDRRFDDRTQVSLLVRLKFPRLEDFRYRYTKDISKGGIFLLANAARPVGTRIVLHLLPPGDDKGLELVGEVAYVVTPVEAKAQARSPGMGVRFIDLTSEKRRAIESYLVGVSTSLSPPLAADATLKDADPETPTMRIASVRAPEELPEEQTTARFKSPIVHAQPNFDPDATVPFSRLPDEQLEAEAREQLERVKAGSHYEALGLTATARTIDVRRAYMALTKRYHPDNYFRRASPALTAVLEDLYEHLTEAYDVLSSSEKRAAYDFKIGVSSVPDVSAGADDDTLRNAAARPAHPMQAQQAMFLVMDARKAIKAGHPGEAIQMLRSAVSFDPTNSDARALLQLLLKGGAR